MTLEKEEFNLSTKASGRIDVLVPRCLIGEGANILGVSVDFEGLCSLQIEWRHGKICSINGLKDASKVPNEILLPRFSEPHAHLDKAFSWSRAPNYKGSYQEALVANLNDYKSRSQGQLLFSVEKSLNLALVNGIRAIRSHIDSFGENVMRDWDQLEDVRIKWRDKIFR